MGKKATHKGRGHSFWIADDSFAEFARVCQEHDLGKHSPVVQSLLEYFVELMDRQKLSNQPKA